MYGFYFLAIWVWTRTYDQGIMSARERNSVRLLLILYGFCLK